MNCIGDDRRRGINGLGGGEGEAGHVCGEGEVTRREREREGQCAARVLGGS